MVFVVPKRAAPNSLSTMAEKVPQYKKVRDQAENNRRHRSRDAIVKIVDFALKHASQAPEIWQPIDSNLCTNVPANAAAYMAGSWIADDLHRRRPSPIPEKPNHHCHARFPKK